MFTRVQGFDPSPNATESTPARRLGLAPKDVAHHPKHQAPEGPSHEGHRETQPGGHGGAVEEMASVQLGKIHGIYHLVMTVMTNIAMENHHAVDRYKHR